MTSSSRYATDAPDALKQLLLSVVVVHLIALGWDQLTAELEVHLRMRRLHP